CTSPPSRSCTAKRTNKPVCRLRRSVDRYAASGGQRETITMRLRPQTAQRRGSVLPLVTLCLVGLIGMGALAGDIGMIAVARNQCQNAADASAMAGARTITGDNTNNYNIDQSPINAIKAANENTVFGVAISGNANSTWSNPNLGNSDHPNAYTYN